MTTFEHRRRVLLSQMLPHTWIGHPCATLLSILGWSGAADAVHYWTLPHRVRRRLRSKPHFNPDPRLWVMDSVLGPLCSLARALGLYRAADLIFRLGPHELATELGACGYYYSGESPAERALTAARIRKEEALETAKHEAVVHTLEGRGFRIQRCTRKGTSYMEPWVWVKPEGINPSDGDMDLIELSGHDLKDQESEGEYDFEDVAPLASRRHKR